MTGRKSIVILLVVVLASAIGWAAAQKQTGVLEGRSPDNGEVFIGQPGDDDDEEPDVGVELFGELCAPEATVPPLDDENEPGVDTLAFIGALFEEGACDPDLPPDAQLCGNLPMGGQLVSGSGICFDNNDKYEAVLSQSTAKAAALVNLEITCFIACFPEFCEDVSKFCLSLGKSTGQGNYTKLPCPADPAMSQYTLTYPLNTCKCRCS